MNNSSKNRRIKYRQFIMSKMFLGLYMFYVFGMISIMEWALFLYSFSKPNINWLVLSLISLFTTIISFKGRTMFYSNYYRLYKNKTKGKL